MWSLWFIALIALTGLWYPIETLSGRAAVPPLSSVERTVPAPTGLQLDRLVARAWNLRPSLEIREIRFAGKNGAIMLGQDTAWLVRDRADGLALAPANGRVITQLDGPRLNLHQRLSEMADPLHYGTFAGLATKVIWFLFDIVLTGMSIPGVIIYAKRLEKAEKHMRSAGNIAWSGMGAWAYACTALVILALVLTPFAITGAS
ncbi:hypothetical protein MBENS4_1023 [Novosphingobium sp. MBES04]|nr:hypothetical protein MBENS4_1023 [Novosphingobium sp. MBES04]